MGRVGRSESTTRCGGQRACKLAVAAIGRSWPKGASLLSVSRSNVADPGHSSGSAMIDSQRAFLRWYRLWLDGANSPHLRDQLQNYSSPRSHLFQVSVDWARLWSGRAPLGEKVSRGTAKTAVEAFPLACNRETYSRCPAVRHQHSSPGWRHNGDRVKALSSPSNRWRLSSDDVTVSLLPRTTS